MFVLDGERFDTEAEYKLALKDKEIIDSIKKLNDLTTASGIEKAYSELKTVHFYTNLGKKFDDHIYELHEDVKAGRYSQDLPGRSDKVKKSGRTLENKKIKDRKDQKDRVSLDEMSPEIKKQVLKEVRKRNRTRNILVILLVVIAAGSFAYFIKYYKDASDIDSQSENFSELKNSDYASVISVQQSLKKDYDDTVTIPDILDEYKILYNKNKSLIGWIKIDDTIIDYPVMQTVDNEYYLKHNFNQEKDNNGCIFLDTNCDVILGNTNWILYGHHMQNGKMFASLIKYANQDFYEEHKIINFDTIYEKGTYEVMYAFRSRVYSSDEITFKYYQFIDAHSAEEFDSAMEEMAALSLIDTGVTAAYGDRLLTLSTCDYQETNGRFVVVAKRID